jgi:hypothetical protein
MNKGIFWSIELIIGILLFMSLLIILNPNQPFYSPIPAINCHDLLTIWSYGDKNIGYYADLLSSHYEIQTGKQPIIGKKKNQVSCSGIRYSFGELERVFILIQW